MLSQGETRQHERNPFEENEISYPKLFNANEDNETTRPVTLVMRLDEDGDLAIEAVGQDGGHIATLLCFDPAGRLKSLTGARQSLECNGIDTSFANWGPDGEIVLGDDTDWTE